MKWRFFLLMAFMSMPAYAIDELTNENELMDKQMNCQLIDKRLDLVKSQLAVVVEQYKIFFKKEMMPQLKQAQTEGKNAKFTISGNNKYAQAIAKLSMAEATYEALSETCKTSQQSGMKTN